MNKLCIVLFACLCLVAGCGPKQVTKDIDKLDAIQGKWAVLHIVGPDGKAFEANNVTIEIKSNVAFQSVPGEEPQQLRLEFNADGSYMKLYAKVPSGEKLVGEVKVTITTDEEPVQMLWADRNNPTQETLMEKMEE